MNHNIVEQGSGLSRTVLFVLGIMALSCVSLIGATGYLKFQMDRTGYVLAATSDSISVIPDMPPEAQKKQADLTRARQSAERDLRLLSFLMTLATWCSLVIATSLIVSLYLVIQRRQSPALRALAQSVANLARGDMQTPIWGIQRSDSIGELARSLDQARYHFSQLPDMSIIGEQGPIRIKFEGGAKSMFDAMMMQLSSQTSRITDQAADLATTATNQHKMLTDLPLRLNSTIDQIQKNSRANDQAIQSATKGLTDISGQLQLLVPFMQKRAQSMAEVTQIAGQQVSSTLKTLMTAEEKLKETSGNSQKTIEEIAMATKELGERIFATLNLLQASSKVLNDTTDASQSRLRELIDTLGTGEAKLQDIVSRVETRLEATSKAQEGLSVLTEKTEASTERMDSVIKSITERHDNLSSQIDRATSDIGKILVEFNGAHEALDSTLQNINRDSGSLGSVLQDLKSNNEQVLSKLSRTTETGHEIVQHLSEVTQDLLKQMQDHIGGQTKQAQEQIELLCKHNSALIIQSDVATRALADTITSLEGANDSLINVEKRFEQTVETVGGRLEEKAEVAFGRTEILVVDNHQKLTSITSTLDQAVQKLSVLNQLTGALGSVAGQLGQLVPTLGGSAALTQEQTPAKAFDDMSEKFMLVVDEKLRLSSEHLDSVRDDIASLMTEQMDQIEMRIKVLDKQVKNLPDQIDGDPRQIALLENIVETLAIMNNHLNRFDEMSDNVEHALAQDASLTENLA